MITNNLIEICFKLIIKTIWTSFRITKIVWYFRCWCFLFFFNFFKYWWCWTIIIKYCWICYSRLLFINCFKYINFKRWYWIINILGCICILKCYWILVKSYFILGSILLVHQDCFLIIFSLTTIWWCSISL